MWNTGFRDGWIKISFVLMTAGVLVFSASPLLAKGYRPILKEWSRHKQLYSPTEAQVKIIAHATYFSPEFREAYAREHIRRKYLEEGRARDFRERLKARQEGVHEFFVGMYAPRPYRGLSLGKETFWEAVLTTASGETVKPVAIEEVEGTPYQKIMFPYLNRWSKAYRVVFPEADLGGPFSLTLRSVIGQTHLRWD